MEPYSTLEPTNPESDPVYRPSAFHEGLEATPIESHHSQSQIEAFGPYEGQYLQPKHAFEPIHDISKPEESPLSASTRPASSLRQIVDETAIVRAPPAKRTFGLRRRNFWILISVVAIVLIGAIVGGVAGGLAAKGSSNNRSDNSDGSTSNSDSPTGDGPKLHDLSKITATNWTDSDKISHKILFLQGEDHGIFARLWDSHSAKWTTSNITEIMSKDAGGAPAAFAGASLAVAGTFDGAGKEDENDHQIWLWYQTKDHKMNAIGNSNTSAGLENWTEWTTNGDPDIEMDTRSRMAATYRQCSEADLQHNCVGGTWNVLYQDPDGNVRIANSTDWGSPYLLWAADEVARPTGLAILPFFLAHPDRFNTAVQRHNNEWQRSTYNDGWKPHGNVMLTGMESPTSKFGPQFAGTKWSDMTQQLYTAMSSNGDISMWWKNDRNQDNDTVIDCNFNGWDKNPSPKWRSIAMDMASTFYGISQEGWVLEFGIGDGTGEFEYKSTVYQPNEDT